jgi:hypothetical protein
MAHALHFQQTSQRTLGGVCAAIRAILGGQEAVTRALRTPCTRPAAESATRRAMYMSPLESPRGADAIGRRARSRILI